MGEDHDHKHSHGHGHDEPCNDPSHDHEHKHEHKHHEHKKEEHHKKKSDCPKEHTNLTKHLEPMFTKCQVDYYTETFSYMAFGIGLALGTNPEVQNLIS